jgi:acyl carrier protein
MLDVRRFILTQLTRELAAVGMDTDDVPDDFDLLAAGVMDSFGYLELISALEANYQIELDFTTIPADQLTILGSLAAYVSAALAQPRPNAVMSVSAHRPSHGGDDAIGSDEA